MDDRKKRKEAVEFALTFNTFGGVEPSDECKKLIEDYIEGKSTPEKNIEKLKKIYSEKAKNNA
ncbi:hypothetical protein F8154_14950 [Alkaliphilus pronyensis]|uniref:Antitoxin VbhA domain-containing protein n=1 Tax=Alkaliphilus pronyensis TaxID=1482732 RepID=A0A6I0EW92_9FIRM|nr:antitoxin VbhA family protein [Alkaliphilus pronyensis]KAB3529194.1 hypothetical protein F8154_14950 [Alkaliphilus pronyensis]